MLLEVVLSLLACIVLADLVVMRRFLVPRICDHFEKSPSFNVLPASPRPDAVPISFHSTDGVTLRGSLINSDAPAPPGLVLFFPEHQGNHWTAPRYCQALIEQGYVVMAFDVRNQGDSDSMAGYTPSHWMTEYEMRDVTAAMDFIESDERLSTLPLMTFGVSRGGVAALLTACRFHRVRGVVADSAFGTLMTIRYFADRFATLFVPGRLYKLIPDWHINRTLRRVMALSESRRGCRYVHLEDEVRHLESRSVLLISGSSDSYVSTDIARRLQKLAGSGTQLWIVRGAGHNGARLRLTSDYDHKVALHASRCLGSQTSVLGAKSESPAIALSVARTA